ncbi:isopentenyl-diphosphate Delta-isomerase [Microlunatus endophyticus]
MEPMLIGPMAAQGDDVVLVDDQARPIGRRKRLAVHGADTPRHLAFSSWISDPYGRVLLTRRALGKRAWPGVWTNSCCGHPRPGEPVEDAVLRRVNEELGVRVQRLRSLLPEFSYRAVDPSGIVENEFCPVYAATLADPETLAPDADEVMDWVWTSPDEIRAAVRQAPYAFSPWAVGQLAQLGPDAFGAGPDGAVARC